jgi:hypothetical protein
LHSFVEGLNRTNIDEAIKAESGVSVKMKIRNPNLEIQKKFKSMQNAKFKTTQCGALLRVG